MTKAQKNAMSQLGAQYIVGYDPNLSINASLFEQAQPLVLEIGIGMGEHLLFQGKKHPALNFLGIDVHEPGIGQCCRVLANECISNVRLICHDAVEVLQTMVLEDSLDKVYILFPDPWPKKKHHKRRLIQSSFIQLLAKKLKSGAVIHIMTDWLEYAENIKDVFATCQDYKDVSNCHALPDDRVITKFERKGVAAQRCITHLVFEKI